jgi:hypothetical protein
MINITPKQLRKAADIQEKIQSLQEELGQLLGSEVSTPAQPIEVPKKRKFSAAARARMRAAQKARWAKIKGTAPSATRAPKKKISAQGLANIRAAQIARWARIKGAKAPTKRKLSAQGLANIRAGVAKRMAAQGKLVQKPKRKRKMTAAWRRALERAWAAKRAKAAQKA